MTGSRGREQSESSIVFEQGALRLHFALGLRVPELEPALGSASSVFMQDLHLANGT